jgi:type I pantothenate kinase
MHGNRTGFCKRLLRSHDGRSVDVNPHGEGPATELRDPLGSRYQKPPVAARGVNDADLIRRQEAALNKLRSDCSLDNSRHEVVRRVPGATLLAVGPVIHARRLCARHSCASVSAWPQVRKVAIVIEPVPQPTARVTDAEPSEADRYLSFERDTWAQLRASTPLTLGARELSQLQGINDQIDLDEVATIYLPLSRLLNLYVTTIQDLYKVSSTFLGNAAPKVPYIIGVAGSVAVGKSTFARILQALLAQWPDHPKVDLITTDGFLHPNAVLKERGIMNRKGFPESYDTRELLRVLRDIKSGRAEVTAPIYSHVVYDIVDDERVVTRQPDIVILEGLNVLQTAEGFSEFVSDYFDFSIYIDADEANIEKWYIDRFLALRESVFQDPDSFFKFYAELSDEEAVATARGIWREINGRNLAENIAPTRDRASLILRKAADHRIDRIQLRRL